jgi:hypothetical protein
MPQPDAESVAESLAQKVIWHLRGMLLSVMTVSCQTLGELEAHAPDS